METEKHYFKVGLFFLIVLGAFVYYLTAFGGNNENRSLKRYTVYFDHSVDGLTRGAPVKLKGIMVGLVSDIRFVSVENDRILVTADISDAAPVRSDTIASVAFQGITGSTYLSLENTGPEVAAAPLATRQGEQYPVIPSRQSDVQSFLANAPAMMDKLTQTADKAQALFPDAHETLAESAAAFREIKMLARELREDPSIILRGQKYEGYKVPDK